MDSHQQLSALSAAFFGVSTPTTEDRDRLFALKDDVLKPTEAASFIYKHLEEYDKLHTQLLRIIRDKCKKTDVRPIVRIGTPQTIGLRLVSSIFSDWSTVFGERIQLEIEIANSTQYGLGGGLWTRDLQRGHRVAGAIRSGMVWVNTYKRVSPGTPFGGVGLSGYGRDLGPEAIHEYTDAKSVFVNVDAQVPPYYKR